MYKAILYFNNKIISEHKLNEETPMITIGRRDTNSIQIDNAGVSGFHAQIKLTSDGLFYEDLDSTNGSFVDAIDIKTIPTKKVKLKNLSNIDITKYKIIIKDMDIEKEVNIKKDLTAIKAEYSEDKMSQSVPVKNEPNLNKVKAAVQILSGSDIGNTVDIVNKVTVLGIKGGDSAIISEREGNYFIAKDGSGVVLINDVDVGSKATKLNDNDIIKVGNIKMNFFFV